MADQKYCQNCEGANLPDAKFCANCGASFVSTSPPPAPPPPTSQDLSGHQTQYEPPPKPQRRFKKRYVLYGIAVLLVLVIVAAAFSSSQAPSSTDYSTYFNSAFTGGNAIVVQPFTKSTNDRGNAVYKGITRNSSLPASAAYTTVIELTQSQADAKQLYDQMVAQKTNEGFTLRSDWVAQAKAEFPFYTEVWTGVSQQTGQQFSVDYYYDSNVSPSWLFVTNAGGA